MPGTELERARKISKTEPLPLRRLPGRRLANKQPGQNMLSVLIRGRGPRKKTNGRQMMEEWFSMLERGRKGL